MKSEHWKDKRVAEAVEATWAWAKSLDLVSENNTIDCGENNEIFYAAMNKVPMARCFYITYKSRRWNERFERENPEWIAKRKALNAKRRTRCIYQCQ